MLVRAFLTLRWVSPRSYALDLAGRKPPLAPPSLSDSIPRWWRNYRLLAYSGRRWATAIVLARELKEGRQIEAVQVSRAAYPGHGAAAAIAMRTATGAGEAFP